MSEYNNACANLLLGGVGVGDEDEGWVSGFHSYLFFLAEDKSVNSELDSGK